MQNYDPIDSLPVDKGETLNGNDMQIVNVLFGKDKGTVEKFLDGTKDVLVIGIFFAIFSTSQTDFLILRFFPSASTSPYILIFIKTILFMLVYFVFKNMYLVKK